MITLAQARKHLRVDDDMLDDDELITTLINASYQFAENYTNTVILQIDETLKLEHFPSVVHLPLVPVNSITLINYSDTDDISQEFTDYYLDLRELKALLIPDNGFSWPDTNGNYENIVITYNVGYSVIPPQIDQAIYLIIGSLYEQRENHISGVQINRVPMSAEYLLSAYRIVSV